MMDGLDDRYEIPYCSLTGCWWNCALASKVEVEIMERMAEAWQEIESKNARHDTSHKLNREKPMFCMDRCDVPCRKRLFSGTIQGEVSQPSRQDLGLEQANALVPCPKAWRVNLGKSS